MDGKTLEPARIVTHFESDFGAAPKVAMPKGQEQTMVIADFQAKHWMLVYGDYLREVEYALKRLPIEWECLG